MGPDWFPRLRVAGTACVGLGLYPLGGAQPGFSIAACPNRIQFDSQPFRVIGGDVFPANMGAAYGIAQIESYDLPVYEWNANVYNAQGGKGADYRQQWNPDWPLINWLNIRYIFSSSPVISSKFRLLEQHSGYWLYENLEALPRAYMVYQYDVIPDAQEALQTMVHGTFDFRRRAILSAEPSGEVPLTQSGGSKNPENQVEFIEYTPDRVQIHVTSEAPGLLVMSDTFYPGWKASVDEKAVPILRANAAYRSLAMPAGSHEILLTYEPISFKVGSVLSLLSLLIVFVLLFQAWSKRVKA